MRVAPLRKSRREYYQNLSVENVCDNKVVKDFGK